MNPPVCVEVLSDRRLLELPQDAVAEIQKASVEMWRDEMRGTTLVVYPLAKRRPLWTILSDEDMEQIRQQGYRAHSRINDFMDHYRRTGRG